jgi:hypothetical protein
MKTIFLRLSVFFFLGCSNIPPTDGIQGDIDLIETEIKDVFQIKKTAHFKIVFASKNLCHSVGF